MPIRPVKSHGVPWARRLIASPCFSLDTSLLLGKYCGSKLPAQVTSTGHHLRVLFHSDDQTTGKGFRVSYHVIGPKEEKPQKGTLQ